MQNPGFYRWTLKNDKKHQLDKSDNMRHNVGQPDEKKAAGLEYTGKQQDRKKAGFLPR